MSMNLYSTILGGYPTVNRIRKMMFGFIVSLLVLSPQGMSQSKANLSETNPNASGEPLKRQ